MATRRLLLIIVLTFMLLGSSQLVEAVRNGTVTPSENVPWLVSVHSRALPGSPHICGGGLIQSTWVVTADHCVKDESASSLFVVFGVDDQTAWASGTTIDVKNLFRQTPTMPAWCSSLPEWLDEILYSDLCRHDLALIQLSNPAPISGALPGLGAVDRSQVSEIYGWGGSETQLQEARTRFYLPAVNNYFSAITVGQLCPGDSGSPVIQRIGGMPVMVGLVSVAGGNCAQFGRFAKVAPDLAWIEDTIASQASPSITSLDCPSPVLAGTPYRCVPTLAGGAPTSYQWTSLSGANYGAAPRQASSAMPYFTSGGTLVSVNIKLEVCNASGCDEESTVVSVTPRARCVSPLVTSTTATPGGPGQIQVNWAATGGCTQGYYVYFSDDLDVGAIQGSEPGTPSNPDTQSGTYNAGNNTSFVLDRLTPGKTYYVWIFSYGEGDGQNSLIPLEATAQAGQ